MSEIGNIRIRSNRFVKNLSVFVAQAVENVDDDLVQLNRNQMLKGKLKTDAAITPKYSNPYAKKKGFKTPNLKVTGEFQRDMFLSVNENNGDVVITSENFVTRFLRNRYTDKIFGIPKSKQQQASALSLHSLAKLWNRLVLNA
jgi:hypothetical protein